MKKIIFISILPLFINACQKEIIKKTDARTVFEVFWQTMDERYIFFKEKNLNWDSIYEVYYPKINENTSEEEIINYYKEIINYVHDGHVWIQFGEKRPALYHPYDLYSMPEPFEKQNKYYYSDTVITVNPLEISQFDDDIMYIEVPNFRKKIINGILMLTIKKYFNYNNGIIIDIRGNTGGNEYLKLLSLFFNGSKTVLYKKLKTGKAVGQFSDFIPVKVKGNGFFSEKVPVVVLTNRGTYSGGSIFAAATISLSNFYIMGEPTSGGASKADFISLPGNSILSLSVRPYFDINKKCFEVGVQPDTIVEMTKEYEALYILSGQDIVKLNAIKYLLSQKNKH